MQVSFLGNNFRPINELYTTADLPGFVSTAPPAPSLGPSLQIDLSSGDSVRITAAVKAGDTYTLETSQNLSDWAIVGSPESPTEDTTIEWSLPKTGVQQFFRTTSE